MCLLLRLRALLDAQQLMLPEALEGFGPVVQRADGFGVGAIKPAPSLAACANESDVAQDAKVLGDGRLRQALSDYDVADRAFLEREVAQDFAAAWFGDGVEGIGGGGGARHEGDITFLYGNMSSEFFRAGPTK
jgi:hypothetical protein